MKTYTLGKHDLRLFVSFLPEIPAYLSSQLGDCSKREIRVKTVDHRSVLSGIKAELAAVKCKARRRRLSGLLSSIEIP